MDWRSLAPIYSRSSIILKKKSNKVILDQKLIIHIIIENNIIDYSKHISISLCTVWQPNIGEKNIRLAWMILKIIL